MAQMAAICKCSLIFIIVMKINIETWMENPQNFYYHIHHMDIIPGEITSRGKGKGNNKIQDRNGIAPK